jgi:hypothetical protein
MKTIFSNANILPGENLHELPITTGYLKSLKTVAEALNWTSMPEKKLGMFKPYYQGFRGTCAAHSLLNYAELGKKRFPNEKFYDNFEPWDLYKEAKKIDKFSDLAQGTSIGAIAEMYCRHTTGLSWLFFPFDPLDMMQFMVVENLGFIFGMQYFTTDSIPRSHRVLVGQKNAAPEGGHALFLHGFKRNHTWREWFFWKRMADMFLAEYSNDPFPEKTLYIPLYRIPKHGIENIIIVPTEYLQSKK